MTAVTVNSKTSLQQREQTPPQQTVCINASIGEGQTSFSIGSCAWIVERLGLSQDR